MEPQSRWWGDGFDYGKQTADASIIDMKVQHADC
jgi:hypothetical protein